MAAFQRLIFGLVLLVGCLLGAAPDASAAISKVWWTNNSSCMYEGAPSGLPQATIACLYQAGGGNPSAVKNCYFESFAGTSQTQIQIRCTIISSGSTTMWYVYGNLKCPTNSTGTSTCTCSSGYSETNGACYTSCPVSGTQVAGPGTVFEAGNGLTSTVCLASCEASAFMAARQDGKNYVWGPIYSTGRNCAGISPPPSSATDSPSKCSVGKCPGTFNGQSICVPCSETKQTQSSSSASSSATTASGATSSTSTSESGSQSSSTTCKDGSCTTTTTSTTTAANGDKVDKTTTKTEPQSDYCTQNPKAAVCKGTESSWGGTCEAFTCDGDAVQCAQAKGAWEMACTLKTDATSSVVQTGQQAVAGTLTDAEPTETTASIGQFNTQNPYTGTCPQDVVVAVAGKSFTLPLSQSCSWIQAVGWFLVAGATLAGARIAFT